jgi:MFS family permease
MWEDEMESTIKAHVVPPASTPTASGMTARERRTLALSSLGGALEYYDFTIYIFFAATIGQLFFPSSQPEWIRQLQTFSIFALGWLVRPIGGTIIAHFGDRIGRKRMFMLSIFLMAVPTLAIGFLPTYETAGIWAPVLLIVLRLLQGFAIAGEVPGSVVFVAEHTDRSRVGFACAALFALLYLGLFLGSLSGLLISRNMDPATAASIGWRLPFIAGGIFGLIAVYLRRYLSETPLFEQIRAQKKLSSTLPLKEVLSVHQASAVFVLLLAGVISADITGLFQFLQTPLQSLYKFPRDAVYQANTAAILTLAICGAGWGALGDRIGLNRAFAIGCAAALAATWWFFRELETLPPDGSGLTWRYIILAMAGSFICVAPAMAALAFPTHVRFTGFAFPYNVGAAIFAGLIPVFLTWAGQAFGRTSAMYLMLVACVVGLALSAWAPSILARNAGKD